MTTEFLNPDDPATFFLVSAWILSVLAAWLHGDKTGRAAERHVIERDGKYTEYERRKELE